MIAVSAATRLAGVVGSPIAHSLSPVLFRGWIEAAGLDAVYLAFAPPRERFAAFVEGLRGVALGLNITAPFKVEALAIADRRSELAQRSGAANLLVFEPNGTISADNTDGEGLLAALRRGDPSFRPAEGPAVIIGSGGAARGAAAALLNAGSPTIRIVARNRPAAERLSDAVGGRVEVFAPSEAASAMAGASLIVQATPQAQAGSEWSSVAIEAAPVSAPALDMVYRPLDTPFLKRARRLGHTTVDGLAMLIGQAELSFASIFGSASPAIDIRAHALEAMGSDA